MEITNCDLCGSKDYTLVTTQADLIHKSTTAHFSIVKCKDCGYHKGILKCVQCEDRKRDNWR